MHLAPALLVSKTPVVNLLAFVDLELLALALLAALALGRFLREKDGMDVRKNATGGDGDSAEELVQLLIVANGQLDVARNDTGLLVVASGVASKLQNLGGQVLEHGAEVNWSSSADAGSILALLQVSVHTTNGKLKTCLLGTRNGFAALGLAASSCAFACLA